MTLFYEEDKKIVPIITNEQEILPLAGGGVEHTFFKLEPYETVLSLNPTPNEITFTNSPTRGIEISSTRTLNDDLSRLRQRVDKGFEELQTQIQKTGTDEQIKNEVITQLLPELREELLKVTDHAIGTSKELTARVHLPPKEVTDIYLLPVGLFQQLEEYRSDEKATYLFIGALVGAILGILSNWVTNESFVITRISVILGVVFGTFATICGFWARLIHKRVARAKNRILPYTYNNPSNGGNKEPNEEVERNIKSTSDHTLET